MKNIIATLFLFLSLLSCHKQEKEREIRIAINPWPGYEYLYLAQEKGIFKELGVPVRLIEFSSLGDVRRAYERGQVDGICATIVEVLQARANSSRQPQVPLLTDFSNGADKILARTQIKSVTELKGKKIAIEVGTLTLFHLAKALEEYGLTLNDVTLVKMDQASMREAIATNTVDAVVTYPPVSIEIEKAMAVSSLFDSSRIPGQILDVLAIDKQVIDERPQAIVKLIKSFGAALEYDRANPDEARSIMGSREGITAAEFTLSLNSGVKILEPHEQLDLLNSGVVHKAIEEAAKVLIATEQLSRPTSGEEILRKEFLEESLWLE